MSAALRTPPLFAVAASLAAVAAAWVVIFVWRPLDFWVLMTAAQACMITAAVVLFPGLIALARPSAREAAVGLAAAVALYGVFALGQAAAVRLFGFAGAEIAAVYRMRGAAHPALIVALLVCVIGPGEEIYWRGLVQTALCARLGPRAAPLVTAAFYAAVHLPTGNLMLVAAAAVCGLFWGALFAWRKSLWAPVVSHAVWDAAVLVLFPLA